MRASLASPCPRKASVWRGEDGVGMGSERGESTNVRSGNDSRINCGFLSWCHLQTSDRGWSFLIVIGGLNIMKLQRQPVSDSHLSHTHPRYLPKAASI